MILVLLFSFALNYFEMKRLNIVVLICLLFSCWLNNAQELSKEDKYTIISSEFEYYYNDSNYQSIYESFNEAYQEQRPLEETLDYFINLKFQLGNIKKREFIEFVGDSFARFKTTFEGGVMSFEISLDTQNRINGFLIEPYKEQKVIPISTRVKTEMILPFTGKWLVSKKGEFDLVDEDSLRNEILEFKIVDETGKSYKTTGKDNEDYYAYNQKIISPLNGKVVMVVNGINDHSPVEKNNLFGIGNTIVIQTPNNEFVFLSHLKKNSINVKEGQNVAIGDFLGLCGNSGNASEPSLHFHIQNKLSKKNTVSLKSYFSEIFINSTLKNDYSPIKDEIVSNTP